MSLSPAVREVSVHPHACGEHLLATTVSSQTSGSSPRLWGTLPHLPQSAGESRFIPTPVGNTPAPAPTTTTSPVHPHACGEHASPPQGHCPGRGSSPRLWGTQRGDDCGDCSSRFIPTPVGNTCPRTTIDMLMPVHPHACGEHGVPAAVACAGQGSSPRLWGTRVPELRTRRGRRFIPTPVGNTPSYSNGSRSRPVHPHACGEHLGAAGTTNPDNGSSPRLWGTRDPPGPRRPFPRFIPTPVGNTDAVLRPGPVVQVHPHACGEHEISRCTDGWGDGSSPRLWGTPGADLGGLRMSRFIPTPVGNTRLS